MSCSPKENSAYNWGKIEDVAPDIADVLYDLMLRSPFMENVKSEEWDLLAEKIAEIIPDN